MSRSNSNLEKNIEELKHLIALLNKFYLGTGGKK